MKRALAHESDKIRKAEKAVTDAARWSHENTLSRISSVNSITHIFRYREQTIAERERNCKEALRQAKYLGKILYDPSNRAGLMSLLQGNVNQVVSADQEKQVHILSTKQSARLLKQATVIRVSTCHSFAPLVK